MKFENNLSIAKRIFNNILKLGFFKIITFFLSLIFIRVSIDFVGPNNYGVYSLYWSYFLILFSIDFGLLNGLRNDLVIHKNNPTKSDELIFNTFVLLLLTSFSISVLIFTISSFLENPIFNNFQILCLLLLVPVIVSNRIILPINFSRHKPYINSIINASQFFIAIFIIWLLNFFGFRSIYLLLISVLISNFLSLFIFNSFSNNYSRLFKFKKSIFTQIIPMVKENIYFQLTQISGILLLQSNLILLYLFSSKIDLNQYSVIFQYIGISYLLFFAIITPFWSEITDSLKNKTIKLSKLIEWISLIAFSSFFLVFFLFSTRNLFFEIVTGINPDNYHTNDFIAISIYVCSLIALITSIQILNGLKVLKTQFFFSVLSILIFIFLIYFLSYDELYYIVILGSILNFVLYIVFMIIILKLKYNNA